MNCSMKNIRDYKRKFLRIEEKIFWKYRILDMYIISPRKLFLVGFSIHVKPFQYIVIVTNFVYHTQNIDHANKLAVGIITILVFD